MTCFLSRPGMEPIQTRAANEETQAGHLKIDSFLTMQPNDLCLLKLYSFIILVHTL